MRISPNSLAGVIQVEKRETKSYLVKISGCHNALLMRREKEFNAYW